MSNTSIPNEGNIIGPPRFASREAEPQDLGNIGDGTIGTAPKAAVSKKKNIVNKSSENVERVALYSNKNLSWAGVGSIMKGYNILNKNIAEKWLAKTSQVRLATPEEVMKEYGL